MTRLHLHSLALALVAAVGVVHTLSLEPSPETPPPEQPGEKWTQIDHKDLFLLDLTAGPATFAAALVADDNGQATGEVAQLHRILFSPMTSEIIAARSNQPTATETVHDRNILMNSSEKTIIAYFQTETELRELTLRPGEGVAIGELPRFAFRRFKTGCKCECESGDGLVRPMQMHCDQLIEGGAPDSPCECTPLEATLCYAYNDQRELIEGTIRRCRSGLVATDPGR